MSRGMYYFIIVLSPELKEILSQRAVSSAALVNSLSALGLGKQYAAVTQKGCDAVRIRKEVPKST